MAQIIIKTTTEEQKRVIDVLRRHGDAAIPMSEIAKLAKIKPNRVRYIISDLCEAGRLKRVPTKAFNAHYVRYGYIVIDSPNTVS
jgi:DNA-binding Lrp family transcriptional regulator